MRCLCSLAAVLCLSAACGRDAEEIPQAVTYTNIVVVMIDTLRSDVLTSYGSEIDSGEALAGLAENAIQVQGYAVSSWTRPSVATLLTGLYPQRHGVRDRTDALSNRVPYLPELLQQAGIQTAALVTNGNVSNLFGFARGFDLFRLEIGTGKPSTDRATPWALALAEKLEPPFFYYIHLMDPHTPYLPASVRQQPDLKQRDYLQPQQLLSGEVEFNDEHVDQLKRQYIAEIQEMDPELDALLSGLRQLGLLEDTLVILTSDHGEEFDEHGGLAHGESLFEEVLRVPMLLWSETGLDAYHSDSPFHQVDFTPTILEALGIPLPSGIDGQSQWKAITSRQLEADRDLLFHLDRGAVRLDALISGSNKLIRNVDSGEAAVYDLVADPSELVATPLGAGSAAEIERRLAKMLERLEHNRYEPEFVEPTFSVKDQLEALGYLGGN